ncbi:hypothetical protein BH695_2256 [Microcystis aeruginosa PCC 7806SL]|uniref:Uncharacterized protein n=1 Tax=Microcystis aeruginosa PCC 7806SL TaxID=1903187 RepID=A0AB33BML6_MICA7|nr:hypothetical protein BH695_2256 [Microcystis aeruginosa PCC 7806SL]
MEYKKEYKRDSYLLKLIENQDNYSFVISGMPEPDQVIAIKLDEFFDVRKIWLFVTCYGSIGGHKSTKSLSGKGFN